MGGGVAADDSLGQLHLYLLADLLSLLVAADGEDVAVFQLLLAGSVPKLHGQQLLSHPARESPCRWTRQDQQQHRRGGKIQVTHATKP